VTNAIRHAGLPEGDPIGLEFSVEPGAVRVAVVDAGGGFAEAPPDPEEGTGGWGLVLIERLSDRWGVHSTDPHSVWFEIDR
jgi:anti-sigma regulatory factor (Ser/Thr protein kinase)